MGSRTCAGTPGSGARTSPPQDATSSRPAPSPARSPAPYRPPSTTQRPPCWTTTQASAAARWTSPSRPTCRSTLRVQRASKGTYPVVARPPKPNPTTFAERRAALARAAPMRVEASPPPTPGVRGARPAQGPQMPGWGTGSWHLAHSAYRAAAGRTGVGTGGILRSRRLRSTATAECTGLGKPGSRARARSAEVHPRSSHWATSGASACASASPRRRRGSGRITRNSVATASRTCSSAATGASWSMGWPSSRPSGCSAGWEGSWYRFFTRGTPAQPVLASPGTGRVVPGTANCGVS